MRSAWSPLSARSLFALAALALSLPLSGCLEDPLRDPPVLRASTLFDFRPIDRGLPGVEPVGDCAALHATLHDRALQQARVQLDQAVQQEYHHFAMEDSGGFPLRAVAASADGDAAASSPEAHSGSAAGAQVTGTNNQEVAADESDLVKTDGEWTYILSAGTLYVLRSRTVGDLQQVAAIPLAQDGWWAGGELLLERRGAADPRDDRLVAILPGQPVPAEGLLGDLAAQRATHALTRIVVLSLANRSAPAVEHETWIEGQPMGGRLVDGVAYVVVQRWEQSLPLRTWVGPEEGDLARLNLSYRDYERMDTESRLAVRQQVALAIDAENRRLLDGTTLEEQLPLVLRSRFGFLLPEPVTEETCRTVLSAPAATGRSFSTILALDVAARDLPSSTTQVVGGSAIVYADAGALVLAAPATDIWWTWAQPELEEATDLLWFDLNGLDVVQRAAGRVPGQVLDSFSIDVHGERVRVATTLGTWGRWWAAEPVPMVSQLMVLQEVAGFLVPVGEVGGIAPGEKIWSARFTDERAYLVTFRQTDPLWVIDLSSPVPRILGELKIEGVSTYIHPLSDDLLLTIGYGAGPGGLNLDWSRIQVSLFDISDVSRPERADVLDLSGPSGSAFSGAVDEHRAFTFWDAIDTLAVPLTTTRSHESWDHGRHTYTTETHVGLTLVTVDQDQQELRLRGEVDQNDLLPASQDGCCWYGGTSIQRSWFLGFPEAGLVSVYAMSPLGVTSNDLATLERQDEVAFPQNGQQMYAID